MKDLTVYGTPTKKTNKGPILVLSYQDCLNSILYSPVTRARSSIAGMDDMRSANSNTVRPVGARVQVYAGLGIIKIGPFFDFLINSSIF